MVLGLLAIREPEVFWLRHEKNAFLHSHKKFSLIDVGVGQEHPPFPIVRSEKVLPIFLITFIYIEHTSVNFMMIRFYPQLLRNNSPFSNKMCTHETSVSVIGVILNPLLTEIDCSFTWENDTILVCYGRTGLKNDVHITCTWEI